MIRTACILALFFEIAANPHHRTGSVIAAEPFTIEVTDADSQRGVPLVELETVNHIGFVTDNAGLIAFDEPGLLGQRVFFHVRSHGYESPRDGFGAAGLSLVTSPGGRGQIKLKRINIAERLYRITGQGLYADSIRLGRKAPLQQPLLNGQVVGQDSTQAVPYRGKIRWFWGDTLKPAHPLGHFQTAGATSLAPESGGLDPAVGIDLTYFTRPDGFSRPMAPLPEGGLVWIDGLLTVPDERGPPKLVTHFSRRKDLGTELEHGVMIYDDARDSFARAKSLDAKNSWRHPRGQATLLGEHCYFAHPFITTRVRATLDDALNPAAYESLVWTKSADGRSDYVWQRETAPLDQKQEAAAIKAGSIPAASARWQLRDAKTKQPVLAHVGTTRWNEWRKRWVMICVQHSGSSFLGEVWYAEASEITGPWSDAAKIVTHDKYSFYNPVQHSFLDQRGGQFIYFEGTYTNMFSGNAVATPRYEYNQMMYRLDLADPRLAPARVE